VFGDPGAREIDEAIAAELERCGATGILPSILADLVRIEWGIDPSMTLLRLYELRDEGRLSFVHAEQGTVVLPRIQVPLPLSP
jgi:hypothetical protein